MSKRPGLFSEISWFQVATSVLAAVTAAWIASSLGVAGTLIGAALGSFVVTISSAFYSRTLDRGKTLIVQTSSGTVIQKAVQDGEIAEAFEEVAEVDHSPVESARVVSEQPRRLHWKTIVATTVVVLGIAVAAMGSYELVTGDAFGTDPDNPRIGNPFGGSSRPADEPTPTADPTVDPTAPVPTPSDTIATPTPTPSTTTPAPDPTDPAATPSPTPDVPAE